MTTAFDQYVETALWSSSDNENGDSFLDENYSLADVAAETRMHLLYIWKLFCMNNRALINAALEHNGNDIDQIAHDLWLTQNGHGAGFWDRDYPEDIGKKLTEAAEKMGQIDLYVGDNGKIYHL